MLRIDRLDRRQNFLLQLLGPAVAISLIINLWQSDLRVNSTGQVLLAPVDILMVFAAVGNVGIHVVALVLVVLLVLRTGTGRVVATVVAVVPITRSTLLR